MMRLTALYADAWNADWQDNAEIVAERMKLLDEACLEVGREPSGLVRTGGSQFAMAGCQDRWYPIRGSVDDGRGDAFVPGCPALPLRSGSVHDGDTARFCEGDRGLRPG